MARKLLELNIDVEAGLFTPLGAERLVASGLAEKCLRIMFEPIDEKVGDALNSLDAIEKILKSAKILNRSRLLHGFDSTAWPLLAGSYSQIGCPKLAASFILVLKLTIVLNILSAKCVRNSPSISRAIFVRISYMLARTLTSTIELDNEKGTVCLGGVLPRVEAFSCL